MSKKFVLVLIVLAILILFGTSVRYKEEIAKLEVKNQELAKGKQEPVEEGGKAGLSIMTEGKQEKGAGSGEEDAEVEKVLTKLTDDFLFASFGYTSDGERIEHMRPYMTDCMYEVYQSPLLSGDSGESQVRCAGRIKEKMVYHVEVGNGKADSVSRIVYTFQVEGQEEIVNDALVELCFVEQSDGTYLVGSQKMYALAE